jgi:two-component system phosphate regulon sensor histidine kinase PhoR
VLSTEVRLSGAPEKVVGIRAAPFSGSRQGDIALLLLGDLSETRRHEKMQKEFVSNVSHELRTPITAVRATAEALIAGAKNDEEVVDRFLNTIVAESDRLSALIDDLMEIAKRESGVTRTEKGEFCVAEIVRRAFATVRPLAEQKQVEVGFAVSDGLVARADEIQLVQLVRNLLDNAVKYTPAGGRVDVAAARADGEISISVRDTGIGIPHGEVDRIFERFYRVDKARSRRLGGTGLGLAIVRDIVEAHGGRIEVVTELGAGSTFTVTLPVGVE